jgi:hypothetical protein
MKIDWELQRVGLEKTTNILLRYIGFEIAVRKMHPNSIKQNYIAAISNQFVLGGIENSFEIASKQKIIKIILEGYTRIHYKANPKSGSRKIAFTIELIKYLREAVQKWKLEEIIIVSIETALKIGIYFLLRKSEFVPSQGKKGISWNQLSFFDNRGGKVDWKNITQKKVQTITINIPFSKTDQYGVGRIVTHIRATNSNGCCIVESIVQWAIICRDQFQHNTESFMFQRSKEKHFVNDNLIAKVMKQIAIHLGWKPDNVSMHSLRYGGATMLAAAGLPQYIIEYFGGWADNSKALRETYIKIAAKGAGIVSEIFSKGYNSSLEEIRIREAKLI